MKKIIAATLLTAFLGFGFSLPVLVDSNKTYVVVNAADTITFDEKSAYLPHSNYENFVDYVNDTYDKDLYILDSTNTAVAELNVTNGTTLTTHLPGVAEITVYDGMADETYDTVVKVVPNAFDNVIVSGGHYGNNTFFPYSSGSFTIEAPTGYELFDVYYDNDRYGSNFSFDINEAVYDSVSNTYSIPYMTSDSFVEDIYITFYFADEGDNLIERYDVVRVAPLSTSYRYFITDEGHTLGFNKTGEYTVSSVSYNDLETIYDFNIVDANTYTISIHGTSQVLCYKENNFTVRFYDSSSIGAAYDCNWVYGTTGGGKTYLKAKNGTNNYYLGLNDGNWKSLMGLDSSTYLSIFSVEEDAAPFVTAMNNIACTDLVNGPKKTGENSWESASTAFSGLQQPTKNYLKTLASDKTEGTIDTVEKALAKYDYIVNKYNKGSEVYTPFIEGRDTSELVTSSGVKSFNSIVSNAPIIIATVLVATLSLTSVLLIKKKNK